MGGEACCTGSDESEHSFLTAFLGPEMQRGGAVNGSKDQGQVRVVQQACSSFQRGGLKPRDSHDPAGRWSF